MLLVGITFAVLLADRLGRIKLQVFGFIGCAVGLLVASCAAYAGGSLKIFLIFAGVMLFNFMTDLGPNAQTYLLAGEVFPTAIRGSGAGFAAAFAKIGAVLTAFLFPILLKANPQTAAALRDFLLWTIGAGKGNDQKALDPLHFTTLPEFVRTLSDAQIRSIN